MFENKNKNEWQNIQKPYLTSRKIIIRGLKKEGSKEKIPTYFAANQSNKDQTKQTPACSSKHLALGHQTIDFQTEKKENQKLSIRGFSSTLEQSYLVSYAKWSENF